MLRKYCFVVLLAGLALALFSCTKRKPEEIDYAPNSPCNPYPADSSANIDHTTLDVTLSWSAYDRNTDDVLTYEVFFDTLNPPITSIASGLTSPSYFVDSLSYNTTYYWKVFATDQAGTTTASIVWRFTTLPHANSAPNVPSYLYPLNGAAWQYPTLYLSTSCSDPEGSSDTLYYDLYLGNTLQPPLTLFKNDTSTIWNLTGINYASTYYWKVVVRDNHYAYAYGPVYSFTTRDCPWFYKKELPSARYGFGTAVVNGKIYVIGGTDGINYLNEVLEYDPALDSWTRKADMPTARSDLAVTVWDNKIYAIGGSRTINDLKNNNEAYDPASNTWSVLAPAPASHLWTTANAVNGRIYLFGSSPVIWGIHSEVFDYLVAGNAWWDTTHYWNDTLWTDTTYTVVDTIISDSSKTNLKSELPNGKIFYCSVSSDNLIYIIGGTTKSGLFPPNPDVYHPATNAWTTASDMIGPVSGPSATLANGYIYVIGGYDGSTSKRVRKYDPLSGIWAIRSDLQKERSFFGAAVINNRIYAFGGVALFPVATMEEYQFDLDPKNTRR